MTAERNPASTDRRRRAIALSALTESPALGPGLCRGSERTIYRYSRLPL